MSIAGIIISCLCICFAFCGNLPAGELKVSESNGKFYITHPVMKVTIDPLRGGRVSELAIGNGANLLGKAASGLCLDHMKQNGWPGELMNSVYAVKSKKISSSQFKITLSKVIAGKKATGELAGLTLEKIYTIDSDSYCIQVKYRIVNATGELRQPAFWVQNVFSDSFKIYEYFRPSETGIARAKSINKISTGMEYVTPVSGWSATLIPEINSGLLMMTDYNYTERFYNCFPACSMEVFFDKIVVPAGKTWETVIQLRPLSGFKTIYSADNSFVSGMAYEGGPARFEIASTMNKKRRINLEIEAKELGSNKPLAKLNESFKSVSFMPTVTDLKIGKAISTGLLNRITMSKRNIILSRCDFFVPAAGSKAMEGFGTGYSVEKKQKRQKIFVSGGKKVANGKLEVLFVNGLFHDVWGVKKISSLLKPDKVTSVYHVIPPNSPSMVGHLTNNPMGVLQELLKYDVVVISNIPAKAIGLNGNIFLKQFVLQGGVLVVLGGRFAYGAGEYKNSPLEEILPCRVKRNFDFTRLKEPLEVKSAAGKSLGYVAWIHDLAIAGNSKTLATAGKLSFLISGNSGKGTVIACTGTVAGVLAGNQKFFWESDEWAQLLSKQILLNCHK